MATGNSRVGVFCFFPLPSAQDGGWVSWLLDGSAFGSLDFSGAWPLSGVSLDEEDGGTSCSQETSPPGATLDPCCC